MEKTVEVDRTVEEEIEVLRKRNSDIDARAELLDIVHEDVVVIHRYDKMATLTFLALAEKDNMHRLRTSWYGRVIKTSPIDCGDAIREAKKQKCVKDSVVVFNPDAAYSLNVADFDEIWILHTDSIIAIDNGYDFMRAMEANAKKKAEIASERMKGMVQQVQAQASMEAIKRKAFDEAMKKNQQGR